jgi:hypothetical protein
MPQSASPLLTWLWVVAVVVVRVFMLLVVAELVELEREQWLWHLALM